MKKSEMGSVGKIVVFGAGKIGRSFVGQLFARAGFEVVFVDLFQRVIEQLNLRGGYDVIIKKPEGDEVLHVSGVRGIMGTEREKIAEELAECRIAAVSVGQKGLPHIVPNLAAGLRLRYERYGIRPLDIILAENMREAGEYVMGLLRKELPDDFPLTGMTGLVETSIGKMVPIMPLAEQERDPLLVYAESYNTLILDNKAFKNPIPDVAGLAPKDNIKAWVDRKSYIHNFGHAAAAYRGYVALPEAKYLSSILKNSAVYNHVRSAMMQSAAVLMAKYPGEFTEDALREHIDDLLSRFANEALGDTVFRVGCDLRRKLYRTDRVLSPLLDGVKMELAVDKIAEVFADGLHFRATGEDGRMLTDDETFASELRQRGVMWVVKNICGLDPENDRGAVEMICSPASGMGV